MGEMALKKQIDTERLFVQEYCCLYNILEERVQCRACHRLNTSTVTCRSLILPFESGIRRWPSMVVQGRQE